MNDKKKFNYLGTILSLLAILVCIFVYAFTEEKSEWHLKLLHDLMPHLIGPIVIILIIYHFLTKQGIYFFTPEEVSSQSISIALSDIPKDSFGIELKSHVDGAKVERETKFHGTYRNIPKNIRLRVYVVNENQTSCWINTQDVILNANDKTWEVRVYVGGINSKGHKVYIVIALEEDITDQWREYYKSVSKQINEWRPLKYPLPSNVVETNKIKVERI